MDIGGYRWIGAREKVQTYKTIRMSVHSNGVTLARRKYTKLERTGARKIGL